MEQYVAAVRIGQASQNLISPLSLDTIWQRHVVDSAQLLPLGDEAPGMWIDVGSGAGFPGMVVAIMSDRQVTLIEPRKRRAEFLRQTADALGLTGQVSVIARTAQATEIAGSVISARAVSPLTRLFDDCLHLARRSTIWVLPKGRHAREEVAEAEKAWQGVFHVEPSITDPESMIVVARNVRRR
ncbi:16S rRNA (guanine(527)-N(7))-methyltransferase RsmG [soil metagenome]